MDDLTEIKDDFDGSLRIAIIGMAARFPGAKDIDEFWENLCAGRETIHFFTDEELKEAGVAQAELDNPNYVKAAPILDDIDLFDASFFDYTPMEANFMDPQQRLLLECAWQALEHAGYTGERASDLIGVYAGIKMNTYVADFFANADLFGPEDKVQIMMGNADFAMGTRISYKLNLKGPSYMVQTACSTSLAAVHLACQALLLDECRMALAGAVAVEVPHKIGYYYQYGGPTSPDGHCRPFDARAQGTIFGSGVGMVVLKRLDDALADGDHIYAVIRGTAVNNDGAVKASFTAPSVEGQTAVILEALACANVDVNSISYVEAHGTATPLGDPIEIMALTNAFRAGTSRKGFCRIGSVKSNLGHLDAAAGMAGLIKTVLALKHKKIPASLYFEQPNPEIDFANSPFFVNTELTEWEGVPLPRRAGVSSFGFGGTNTHVILEEAPPVEPSGESRPWQLLVLSARTSTALDTATANLAAYLKQNPDLNLADVAYTLQVGRRAFKHRRMVVCRDLSEAVSLLETVNDPRVLTTVQKIGDRPVAFMFTGQGAQYVNMGLELYQVEPVFREHLDRCAELLIPHLDFDLRTVLYPDPSEVEAATQKLTQTAVTQPALFVIEYALAQLWQSWGVEPAAMIGHSIGEYVAACLAGIFSLEDALALVAARGRLMQQMPQGAMLSVSLPAQEASRFLKEGLSLAASNGPSLCVVSGPTDAIAALQDRLTAQGITCRRLHTSHAFHSEMMEPIWGPFLEEVKRIRLHAPQIPYISNVTGDWITAEAATDPHYWVRHLRQTVRFAEGIQELLREPNRILLEVGPGRTSSSLAMQQLDQGSEPAVFSSIRHPQQQQSDVMFLLTTLGRLWLIGQHVDWSGFYAHERRHRLPLPTYPFERRRYWVEQQKPTRATPGRLIQGKNPNVDDWFFVPTWRQTSPLSSATFTGASCWLVFVDGHGLGTALVERLHTLNQVVIKVVAGETFGQYEDETYMLDPKRQGDYVALIQHLKAKEQLPGIVAHLWSVTADDVPSDLDFFEQMQDLGYYSLLFLVQALAQEAPERAVRLGVITNRVYQISGSDKICPEKATLLGPHKVAPQEYANVSCTCIDVAVPTTGTRQEQQLLDDLITELASDTRDSALAYRGGRRWVQTYSPAPLGENDKIRRPLREQGVYLITGGLGNVGGLVGQYLARTVKARLVLSSRSGLPPRSEWGNILATSSESSTARKIRHVQALEALGAEVMVACADVADEAQMRDLVTQIYDRFGQLNGVLHAAGVTSGPSIQQPLAKVGHAESEMQFRSKVNGLYVIEKVLAGKEIDFYLLFSSNAAVLGGLGFVAYAAANSFLDAFATHRSQTSNTPWLSANWDPWPKEIEQSKGRQTSIEQYTMTPEESQEAFRRVACLANEGQVVVATGDLLTRFDLWITRATGKERQVVTACKRPALSSTYVAPHDETEQKIAEMWAKVLGIQQIGVHDDFFELGGHSLLATQIVSRVRDTFKVDLPLQDLFSSPTVASLAKSVETIRQAAQDLQTPPGQKGGHEEGEL